MRSVCIFETQTRSELYTTATIIKINGIIEIKIVINVQKENGVEKQFEIASQHSPQQSLFQ